MFENNIKHPGTYYIQVLLFLTLNSLIDEVLHSSVHFILVSKLCVENARGVEQHGDGRQVGHVAGGGHGQHSYLGKGWQRTETDYVHCTGWERLHQ